MSITRSDVCRYLALLGVSEDAPSLEGLRAIVRAHLWSVPFENVSKLYRWKTTGFRGVPACAEYLDGIERYHFGGTCYSNNVHCHELLAALGYDVKLCGADMSRPDVHVVSIVMLEGREYIVDVGYAAPLLDPLPRDLSSDHVIAWGADEYVLSPKDTVGWSRLAFKHDGAVRHGYRVNPAPRRVEEFREVIEDSFRPEATFMNALLLARFAEGRATVLRNLTLTESRGIEQRRMSFGSVEELIPVIYEHFSIPPAVTQVALEGLVIRPDALLDPHG